MQKGFMVIALWQCVCVMLTSSPAAVALWLLHFVVFSFFLLCTCLVAWTCGTSTSLSFKQNLFLPVKRMSLWLLWDFFHVDVFGSAFIKCSLLPVFAESRGTFQLVGIFVSVILVEKLFFFALAADVVQGSRLVQGWVTCRVQGFTCCVDKCCLSMQTSFVKGEQRRVSIWFLQDLTPDPTLKPLQNTHTHTYSVLLLAGRRNVID